MDWSRFLVSDFPVPHVNTVPACTVCVKTVQVFGGFVLIPVYLKMLEAYEDVIYTVRKVYFIAFR